MIAYCCFTLAREAKHTEAPYGDDVRLGQTDQKELVAPVISIEFRSTKGSFIARYFLVFSVSIVLPCIAGASGPNKVRRP